MVQRTKTQILLRAKDLQRRAEFRRWLQNDYAPRRLKSAVAGNRITLLIADIGSPFDPTGAQDNPACDAVIDIWGHTPPTAILEDAELAALAMLEAYAVNERIEKDLAPALATGKTPGAVLFSLVMPLQGLPRAEFLRHWGEHVPLALQTHRGMNRYVRNIYLAEPGDGPACFGSSHLHFPDFNTIAGGLFPHPEDRDAINTDVAEFVADSPVIFMTEYVLAI